MENMLEYAEKYFKEKYNREKVNPGAEHIMEQYGCTDEEFQDFLRCFLSANQNARLQEKTTSEPRTGYPSIDRPWMDFYGTRDIKYSEDPKRSIYNYMHDINKAHENETALVYYGREIKYKEMFSKIEEAYRSFSKLGIKKGDVVVLCMPTIPEMVYSLYALNKLGAVSDVIDVISNETITKNYIKESKSKYIVTIDMCSDKISKIVDETKLNKVIVSSISDSLPPLTKKIFNAKNSLSGKKYKLPTDGRFICWEDFIDSGKKYEPINDYEYEAGDPAVIVHTGGTTGVPKSVIMSNEALNSYISDHDYLQLDIKRGEKFLAFLPPFIISGLGAGLHSPITQGQKTILVPDFNPEHFVSYLLKNKPNRAIGAPIYWNMLLKDKKVSKAKLDYFINMISGGDKLSPENEKELNEFLFSHGSPVPLTKGYGMTEVCSASTVTQKKYNDLGSVGIPFPSTIVSIFDPETNEELKYGNVGEIRVSGPTTMIGYRDNEEENKKIFWISQDGKKWVKTGDLGYMNPDGQLFVVDRLKRMITTRGYNIYPSELEKLMGVHNNIEQCIVVGTPNEIEGQITTANIVVKDNNLGNEDNIQEELEKLCIEGNIPDYSLPIIYKFRTSMPLRPNTGKIDYKTLESEGEDYVNTIYALYNKKKDRLIRRKK